jgi:hypothetical protein
MFNFSEVRVFRTILFFFAASFACLISSCNDPEIIGLDVQPQDDLIGLIFSDTATVTAFTIREDSLRTDETSLQLVGSYVDSIFGRSDASIYAQLIPTSSSVSIGDSTRSLDSLVLTLSYGGYYGDTATPLTFHVYRLDQSMSYDSAYYSTKTFSATEELGTATIIPAPNDSVSVYGVETTPHLRININNTHLGDTLLSWSGQSQLLNSDNFVAAFKGLYIKVDNVLSAGSILYFNLIAARSKMTLYYHTATTDSLHYDFAFSLSHARMSNFYHEYAATPVFNQIQDSTNGTEKVYVQAMAGVKTKIRFPNITDYIKDGMIAINKAEVEITVSDNSTNHWAAPVKLLLLGVDSLGNAVFLPDQFQGTAYYGGDYNSSTRKYKFNIAYYLQNILTGNTKDYGLYLAVSGGSVQANRAIIYGGTSTVDKIKLNLFYTKPN